MNATDAKMTAEPPPPSRGPRWVVSWRAIRRAAWWLAPVSLLVPFVAVSTSHPSLTRGPYLQLLTRTSVTVVWRTDSAAACSLELRPEGGAPATRIDGETAAECTITVDGLRPGREYAYVPLADGSALTSPSMFHTDDPNLPYTFLVLGDSGSGDEEQLAVAARMTEQTADFVLHTGDMIYPDALPEEWDTKFFLPYRDLLRRLVLWPSIGNHDIGADDGASWREVFLTPANNALATEHYYSFRHGNSRVIVLDAYDDLEPGSPQYGFLAGELGASTATWKFVVLHDTLYSSGYHGSDESIRREVLPVFDAHGVDVVFMGHDHHYERTWPLREDRIVAPGDGIVYVTTGGGGATVRETGTSSFTAYAEAAPHFVRVAVDGGALQLDMVRADGTIGDTLTLVKELPTTLDVTPVADAFIEAGEDAHHNHGGTDDLKVDADPTRITYLKFDLHRLRTDIRSAYLTLFPTNGSVDGGEVYPVPDATWIEGAGDGTTEGPGITWADVDLNADGVIDASDGSPYVPDFSRPVAHLGPVTDGVPVTVDVTGAFGHRGPGVYSLAIRSMADNGATYASREHEALEKQPLLLVNLAEGLCGNGIVEPGEQCDDAECCRDCALVPMDAPCADDERFCTGQERCDGGGRCRGTGDPCAGGSECARRCDEDADRCRDPAGVACSDDGLACTRDACDGDGRCGHTALAVCAVATDPGPLAGRAGDCYVALAGAGPPRGRRIDCRDGDPACDRDATADGGCAFDLRVCVLQTDLPGCKAATTPVSVERIVIAPKGIPWLLPELPATRPDCAATTTVRVPLKKAGKRPGKLAVKLTAIAAGSPRKDRDKIIFHCLPAS